MSDAALSSTSNNSTPTHVLAFIVQCANINHTSVLLVLLIVYYVLFFYEIALLFNNIALPKNLSHKSPTAIHGDRLV